MAKEIKEFTYKQHIEEVKYRKRVAEICTAKDIIRIVKKLGGESYIRCPEKALVRVQDIVNAINSAFLK